MKNTVGVLSSIVDKISKYGLATSLALAFISTVYQVFSRYVLLSPFMENNFNRDFLNAFNFPWMEEFIRYMFIWSVFLGIPVVYKMKIHARVEVLLNFLPRAVNRVLAVANEILCSFFFILLIVKGLDILSIVNGQLSPSLYINMAWMYFAVIFCALCCLIHSVYFLIENLIDGRFDHQAVHQAQANPTR
jgi:TRAP-type C4-dicarboxylate transport system permease small subunit